MEYKIGDILKVITKSNKEYHYEKVISLTPEILTLDMPEESGEVERSVQGLHLNFRYEIIEDYKIAQALLRDSI